MTDTLTPPTTDLVRTVEFRAEPSADGLTLDGYAAVFGARTTIDSWEGTFHEEIAPGAFKRSLGDKTPLLQFDHGKHPLIGSIPIGSIKSITEDSHGLRVRARLSDNWLVEPVRDAIRDGAITGMSFRFRVAPGGETVTHPRDLDLPLRTLTKLDLFEVGPVVWPAYEQTSVGVRSREVAHALTDPLVRHEVARLLYGADLESLAVSDPLPDGRGLDTEALAPCRAEETPQTPSDFRHRLVLAFADL